MKRELENAQTLVVEKRCVTTQITAALETKTLAAVPLAFAASPLKIYFDRQLRRLRLAPLVVEALPLILAVPPTKLYLKRTIPPARIIWVCAFYLFGFFKFSLIIPDDHSSSSYASVHGTHCSCYQKTATLTPPPVETFVTSPPGNSGHQHTWKRNANTCWRCG